MSHLSTIYDVLRKLIEGSSWTEQERKHAVELVGELEQFNVFGNVAERLTIKEDTTIEEDDRGHPIEIKQAMDACPSCALTPRRSFERETTAALEGRSRDARIAQLERETGLDPESGTFADAAEQPKA